MIMLALVDGTPKVLNLKQILEEYVKHQKSVIVRRTQYDLEKAGERAHILEGLMKALNNIDEVDTDNVEYLYVGDDKIIDNIDLYFYD